MWAPFFPSAFEKFPWQHPLQREQGSSLWLEAKMLINFTLVCQKKKKLWVVLSVSSRIREEKEGMEWKWINPGRILILRPNDCIRFSTLVLPTLFLITFCQINWSFNDKVHFITCISNTGSVAFHCRIHKGFMWVLLSSLAITFSFFLWKYHARGKVSYKANNIH